METKIVTVSIIIPAFNSQATIGRCLQAIRSLNYPADSIEVIVVDNGSTDATPVIARQHGARVLFHPRIFVSAMRNLGAATSTGEALAFIDSDCIVSADWLQSGLRQLEDSRVGAIGCGYAINNPPSWIERHWFYGHLVPKMNVTFLPAGNMLLRKDVFWRIGGFNPRLETGEDSDLCLRLRKLGFSIVSDSAMRNVHLGNPRSLSSFFRKEIWYGKGLAACLNSHDWHDRTFLLTNIFLLGVLLLIAGVPSYFLLGNPLAFLGGAAALLFVIGLASVYRTIRRRNFSSFFPLAALNTVYFLGRSIALLHIYARFYRKKENGSQ
jgi:glycosyltransferase involved in cell wall biosynthesis